MECLEAISANITEMESAFLELKAAGVLDILVHKYVRISQKNSFEFLLLGISVFVRLSYDYFINFYRN